jgi:hypothetical protein
MLSPQQTASFDRLVRNLDRRRRQYLQRQPPADDPTWRVAPRLDALDLPP